MVFFSSDQHFGHANIIRFSNRPFQSLDAMNQALVAAWNSRVGDNDTIYIVGDMFFRCANVESILKQLKGKKHLIVGNHDKSWMRKVEVSRYFLSVDKYLEVSDGAHALTLCHYPLLVWNHARRSFMIHGHIHANTDADFWPLLRCRDNVLNAGVDVNHFRPVSFNELIENNRRFKTEH